MNISNTNFKGLLQVNYPTGRSTVYNTDHIKYINCNPNSKHGPKLLGSTINVNDEVIPLDIPADELLTAFRNAHLNNQLVTVGEGVPKTDFYA